MSSRSSSLDIGAEGFRDLGHQLIDQIADFYATLPERQVVNSKAGQNLRDILGEKSIPEAGESPQLLLNETARLLFDNSVHNGHPRFMGYITSSASPLGVLADLLAAAVNVNVGIWQLSPVATEIESQTVHWLAELIGYPRDCGGLMVSGGNVANLIAYFAARKAKTPWDIRERGLLADERRLSVYATRETHTWIQKATDLSGLGTGAIRLIATDKQQRMQADALREQIEIDLDAGCLPFLVVGTAGTVSTGAIDPLQEISAICKHYDVWFHVDGAYGAPAASLADSDADIRGLSDADSVALDPHKWLYCPIEVGCTLVREPQHLLDAFSFHPDYYAFDRDEENPQINYYEYGIQNTRGFRALKVWLSLRQIGRDGYKKMFSDDIALSKRIFDLAAAHPELEARTNNLSLTTFRYVPEDLSARDQAQQSYLNDLNKALLARLQQQGEVFLSNAVVDGCDLLRACIVNFRTSENDIDATIRAVSKLGRELDRELRSN